MNRGGVTAASCTCSVWENFADTIKNMARGNQLSRENSDLIFKVRTVSDIRRARSEGKTSIVLGFQNVSALEDQLGFVELFKELGVGVAQLAYNTQNLVGSGCYESHDCGLSDFSREVVAEMSRWRARASSNGYRSLARAGDLHHHRVDRRAARLSVSKVAVATPYNDELNGILSHGVELLSMDQGGTRSHQVLPRIGWFPSDKTRAVRDRLQSAGILSDGMLRFGTQQTHAPRRHTEDMDMLAGLVADALAGAPSDMGRLGRIGAEVARFAEAQRDLHYTFDSDEDAFEYFKLGCVGRRRRAGHA